MSHVARFEEMCRLIHPLDLNPMILINQRSTDSDDRYNSLMDGRD